MSSRTLRIVPPLPSGAGRSNARLTASVPKQWVSIDVIAVVPQGGEGSAHELCRLRPAQAGVTV